MSLTAALIIAGFVMILRRSVKAKTSSLQQSEQRFRSLFKLTPIPLGFVNQDGTLAYINDRFVQLFGYTLDDVPTIDAWSQLAYPDENYRRTAFKTWTAAVERSIRLGSDIEASEYQVTCKDGKMERFAMLRFQVSLLARIS